MTRGRDFQGQWSSNSDTRISPKNQFDTQYHTVHDNNTYSLEKLDSINDLGVTFDSCLSFTDHISHKLNKAYSILGILKEISFIWMNPVSYYYTN